MKLVLDFRGTLCDDEGSVVMKTLVRYINASIQYLRKYTTTDQTHVIVLKVQLFCLSELGITHYNCNTLCNIIYYFSSSEVI